jgi:hypothetical protein
LTEPKHVTLVSGTPGASGGSPPAWGPPSSSTLSLEPTLAVDEAPGAPRADWDCSGR